MKNKSKAALRWNEGQAVWQYDIQRHIRAGMPAATVDFIRWRFYDDDGSESASTPLANENTNWSANVNDGSIKFHLRTQFQETAGNDGDATDDYTPREEIDDSTTFNAIGTQTQNPLFAVKSEDTSNLTNGNATTNRGTNGITDPGAGSFVAGEQTDTNSQILNWQLTASNFSEHCHGLILRAPNVDNGTTIDFDYTATINAGDGTMVNSVEPRITVTKNTTNGITFDRLSQGTAGTGNISWTHPGTSPTGVVVFVVYENGTDTSQVTSVTYGGVSLSEITGSPNSKSTGEVCTVECWFVGSGLSTGDQTIAVNVNGTGTEKAVFAYTVLSSGDTQIVDTDTSINSDSVANPSGSLSLGGTRCVVVQGFFSGDPAVSGVLPATGWTRGSRDTLTGSAHAQDFITVGTSDVTTGWTQSADDAVCIAVAIGEAGGPTEQTLSASFTGSASLAFSQPFSRKTFTAASAGTATLATQRPFSNVLLAAQSGFSATIRVLGRFARTFSSSLTGSATMARRLAAARTFTASAIGSASITATRLAAATLITLTAAMAGTASIARRLMARRSFSLSITGTATIRAIGRFLRTLSTSLAGSAALSRRLTAIRKFTASAIGTASITAAQLAAVTQVTFSVVMSGTATLAHRLTASRAFSVIASGSATIRQRATFMRSLSADLTGTATIRTLARFFRTFAASMAGIASITAAQIGGALTQITLTASLVGTVTLNRLLAARRTLATSLTGVAVIRRAGLFLHSLSTSVTGSAALSSAAIFVRTLSASLGGAAALAVRAIHSRMLAASMTATATLARLAFYFRTFTASVTGTATLSRLLLAMRTFTASFTGTAALNRLAQFRRTLSAVAGMTASLTRGVAFTLTEITLATSAGLSATISSLLQAVKARFTGGGGMGIGTPGRWGARKGTRSARKSTWRGRK